MKTLLAAHERNPLLDPDCPAGGFTEPDRPVDKGSHCGCQRCCFCGRQNPRQDTTKRRPNVRAGSVA